MKVKFRFSGRGGQGIKFLGSALVKVAMEAKYFATLAVDYTPSVRGGPIFCDVILSDEPISYPSCDNDGDYFVAIDSKGIERASECIYDGTISFIDSDTVSNPKEIVTKGKMHIVPITKTADENKVTKSTNILSLGFLSEFLKKNAKLKIKEEHYIKVFNEMPERFRKRNIETYNLGKKLFSETDLKN